MKTSMKILLGFVAILILSITQMGLNYKLQRDILDNTQQIKDVEAPLLLALQQGISYASITTEQIRVAVLHALKGQYSEIAEHKMMYDAVDQELSELLNRDLKILLAQSQKKQEVKDSILKKIIELERLHLIFIDLERKAFTALDNKDAETAYSLVMSGDYEKYQQELQPVVEAIYTEITQGVTETENSIIERSQQFILFNLIFSLINTVILLIIMLMIRSFFAGREGAVIKKEEELDIREKMDQTYRDFFNDATEAIFIADSKTRQLVDCNKSAEKLVGYSRGKLLSMKADELHPKDKLGKTMKGFQEQTEGKIKFIFTEVLTKSGQRIPVKISASAVKIGRKTYSQGIFMEVK